MKKITYLFSISSILILSFLALSNLPSTNLSKSILIKPDKLNINNPLWCSPKRGAAIPEAHLFDPFECAPPVVRVRKNISSFTLAEINSLKAGIAAMKALPVSDKTSWTYQAAIHYTTLSGSNPSWNSCQHSNMFFLSWHRMYLYFFERILRSKSGNPNFTLPYWNYQVSGSIPSVYRTPTTGNPLYHAARNPSMNGGGTIPASISTNINSSLSFTTFFPFQTALEGPHGAVHVAVGGDMSSVPTAAVDPVFWLHHTNVDRLWEAWLRKCNGRANPISNTTWMNQVYTFFDESGAAVNMTGSQIVNTASQLNYRYDFPFKLPCNFVWRDLVWREFQLVKFFKPMILNTKMNIIPFKDARELEDFKMIKDSTFQFKNGINESTDQVILELINYKIKQNPEGVLEVYVNLPTNASPSVKSLSFASVVDLFTSSHQKEGNMPIKVDLTNAIKKLKLRPSELNKIKVGFYVRGNLYKGKEVNAKVDMEVNEMNIVLRRIMK